MIKLIWIFFGIVISESKAFTISILTESMSQTSIITSCTLLYFSIIQGRKLPTPTAGSRIRNDLKLDASGKSFTTV